MGTFKFNQTGQSIYDVSFAGCKVVIGGALITSWMDDQNPVDIQDTETTNIEWSCNGRMIRTIKPSAVLISLTVIPGSISDNALRTIWKKHFSNAGYVDLNAADEPLSCTMSHPKRGSFTFTNGTVVSGAAALTTNGQGKMGGNTYTFAFERVE